MALGKAVLVSDIPAMMDYVIDGVNGFLYRTANENDLHEKMRFLLSADDAVNRVGQTARQTAMDRFSEATMSERVRRLLLAVAKRRARLQVSSLSSDAPRHHTYDSRSDLVMPETAGFHLPEKQL